MSSRFRFCPQCAQPLQRAIHGNVLRLACMDADCGFVHWDNPVPVVAAIVEHEGEIVLARNAAWPPHSFALITGFLEKDDPDPASGVLREVEEELGLKGRIAEFVGFYPFERMNQVIIAFHVVAEGTIRLNEELVEYKKLPPAQIRPWPAGTGYAVRDWLLRRGITPLPFDRNMMRKPRAWHAIDERLMTAGQPSSEELRALRAIGVDTVINLSPSTAEHALEDERAIVEALGMNYIHIPVIWEAPTLADFEQFCAAMDVAKNRTVFVHCDDNRRAASFVYLYRVLRLGHDRGRADADLQTVWAPQSQWASYIDALSG